MKATLPAQPPAEETRNKLLQAAIEVFSERGYEGATVRAICSRAEVNVAMVKYCYGDKLELYRAVIHHISDAEGRAELLRQALEEGANPEDALRQLIHRLAERLLLQKKASGLHLRLMLNELVNPTTVLAAEIENTLRPLSNQFRTVVGRVLRLHPDDVKTRLCSHSIIGQMTHYLHGRPILAKVWPELRFTPSQVSMIATHIADFSLAYILQQRTPQNTRIPIKSKRKSS